MDPILQAVVNAVADEVMKRLEDRLDRIVDARIQATFPDVPRMVADQLDSHDIAINERIARVIEARFEEAEEADDEYTNGLIEQYLDDHSEEIARNLLDNLKVRLEVR